MSDALENVLSMLEAHGCKVRRGDPNSESQYPAHEDRRASLSVGTNERGDVLLNCHRGCAPEDICKALGLELRDLFQTPVSPNGARRAVAYYDYTSESYELLFQTVRYEPKDFRQRRPNPNGGWIWNLNDTRRVLYRLPELLAAIERGQQVFLVEGEKDVDSLMKYAGVAATCNPMGAGKGKWRKEFTEQLRGANVLVVADSDETGRRHARVEFSSLQGVAAEVVLKGVPAPYNDVSELLDAGGKLSQLEPLEMPTREPEQLTPLFVADILKQNPDLSEEDVLGAKSFSELKKLVSGRGNAATQIVDKVREAGTQLWHAPDQDCYATFRRDDHMETWPIRSRGFQLWVRWLMWQSTTQTVVDEESEQSQELVKSGSAISSASLADAMAQLEAEALFDGEELEVHPRCALVDNAVFIDLGDEAWSAIHITRDGWTVLDHHPVRFRRAKTTKALPEPVHDGSFALLRAFMNVGDGEEGEHRWRLIVAWLVNCVREGYPFPVLTLLGEHGSAKTTATRVLRKVLDPVAEPEVRAAPQTDEDLMIAAKSSWCICYDNLSRLKPGLSDALCRLATGGGIGKRQDAVRQAVERRRRRRRPDTAPRHRARLVLQPRPALLPRLPRDLQGQAVTTADTLLLKAVPPKWGAGKIHVFENDHNLCGKSRETSPGEVEWGDLQEVTCQICAKGWVAARRREQQQRECAERRATRQG